MILIDTGYLLALTRQEDELHGRAVKWSKAARGPFIITAYILCEVVNAMSLPGERWLVGGLIAEMSADPNCEVIDASRARFAAGLRLHGARADKVWSLTDCISFHLMEERGIKMALAHDPPFSQAGFEALLRRDP